MNEHQLEKEIVDLERDNRLLNKELSGCEQEIKRLSRIMEEQAAQIAALKRQVEAGKALVKTMDPEGTLDAPGVTTLDWLSALLTSYDELRATFPEYEHPDPEAECEMTATLRNFVRDGRRAKAAWDAAKEGA